ncbi:MAG TPA: deoxyribose-phosphate aldolase [Anaerolineales bacterium]|nr:deoxyribose-phosphate aldolase [Anaerolineales bacterium]
MTVNPHTIEQLVEIITKQVLLRLAEEERAAETGQTICGRECGDGLCVQLCVDRVGAVIAAGAERLGAGLGAIPPSRGISALIDHTLLKPEATPDQIAQLCYEARKHSFASVCVNPTHVRLCAQLLRGSPVKVCTVVGFPLGATPPEVKAFETQQAIDEGAGEIDMVINIGAIKSKDYEHAARDVRSVVRAAHAKGAIVKVIIEAALLNQEEKIAACLISKEAGADFVKTSTGFGPGGATAADVALMRKIVGHGLGVKAAGGIRNLADAQKMIEAGATRIGASAGVKIVAEAGGEVKAEPAPQPAGKY